MQLKTVFRESDVLTPEMREEMDRFYRKIDEDLAWDERWERRRLRRTFIRQDEKAEARHA